ncbi:uncharacterized protein LOC120850213 [Ixodes scapularis]|uniref:uncharacterized protein LOC120850213 n=1 Tax=Ixodes scapularis TaxID=6945 RepID=UPI001C390F58|nr:uncharacterized protein LOC120850213 [Ixodes scapularis]
MEKVAFVRGLTKLKKEEFTIGSFISEAVMGAHVALFCAAMSAPQAAGMRQEGRQIFYLDETWVTAGHTVSTVWVDCTVTSSHDAFMRGLTTGLKQPSGKGQRLIVTHIGCEDGFVAGCLDVFRGVKTGDYHEEMNGTRFETWFEAVLQMLPTGNVIVMDHASYHSRRLEAVPTTGSRKEVIQQWLTSKDIS